MAVTEDRVKIGVADAMALTVTGRADGRSRTNLSVLHLLSSATHSRAVGALEQKHSGQPFGEFWENILASATGGVFMGVAALEAYANELFVDHARTFPGYLRH